MSKRHQLFIFTLALLFISVVYYQTGGYRQIQRQQQVMKTVAAVKADPQKMQTLIATLEAKLRREENDPVGWYLLGKLYLDQKQYLLAADCFGRGYQLANNMTALLSWQLFALELAESPKRDSVLKKLVAIDPDASVGS